MRRIWAHWPLLVSLLLVMVLASMALGRGKAAAEHNGRSPVLVTAFGNLGTVRNGIFPVSIGLRVDNNGRRSLVVGPRRFMLLDDAGRIFRPLAHGKLYHSVTPLPRQELSAGRSLVGWLVFMLPAGDPPQVLLFRGHGREMQVVLQTTAALQGQYPAPPTVTPPPVAKRHKSTTGTVGSKQVKGRGSPLPAR